ncbi:hypothetical protein PC9H_005819 [Pleurotus ostreatus]|uniref:Uncharacterized protein n=1 Tax=Pleurotus ostreatus TaxID=5322 RepID=A0A8H7DXE2_PLEOS|nr:uncharacterized protein PC9H_005819 [Pleurotus ostreatus]KAF7433853.1 hypothetical protein PC9H_005819 [Pleurotus ostreatus]
MPYDEETGINWSPRPTVSFHELTWDGEMGEELFVAKKCSKAFRWKPRQPKELTAAGDLVQYSQGNNILFIRDVNRLFYDVAMDHWFERLDLRDLNAGGAFELQHIWYVCVYDVGLIVLDLWSGDIGKHDD